MNALLEVLEDEFRDAVVEKDEKAMRHFVTIVVENFENKKESERRENNTIIALNEVKSDVKILAETMREGFKQIDKRFEATDKHFEAMDKRFEATDKHFEAVDKRFEAVINQMNVRFEEQRKYTDKRFEEQREYTEKRFEAIDKRFEEQREYTEKRFEAIDKRFEEQLYYMDKRFEAVDKRFEDMNKRFGVLQWVMILGFTLMTALMSVYKFVQ